MDKSIYHSDYKVFVRRLKKDREDARLTQVQVAEKLGSSQAYISKVESGQLRVDVIELKKFAKLYGRSTGYFLK